MLRFCNSALLKTALVQTAQPLQVAALRRTASVLSSTAVAARSFSISTTRLDNYEKRDWRSGSSRGGSRGGRGGNGGVSWGNSSHRGGSAYNNRGYDNNNHRPNRQHRRNGGGPGDFDASRNTARGSGPEGDGLLGQPDYERIKDLDGLDLTKLCAKEGSTVEGDFSTVETASLAENKVLSRVLVNSLTENRKYKSLTAVQAQTMIPILRGDSVVVRAKTGTGKTAAFSVPSIQQVIEAVRNGEKGVKALIVSPTRELAQQIADEISAITSYGEMRQLLTVCLVGGLSKNGQIQHAFGGRKKADIIVATPGRLYDILQEPGIGEEFANLKIKILDEADRLLDIGFADALRDIDIELKRFSQSNFQTLLFSATIDRAVRQFASQELGTRAKIIDTVPKDEPEAHELVNQKAIITDNWSEMYAATYGAIQDAYTTSVDSGKTIYKGIVFMPTVPSCEHFSDILKHTMADAKLHILVLHGQMTQAARQRVADQFRRSNNAIMITTDVVARGMDFPNVTHVFQMSTPRDVASYVHRIGRTGRIGNHGDAALILTKHERGYLRDLSQRKIEISDVSQYKPDPEYADRIKGAVEFIDHDDETKSNVIHGLLSSLAHIRKAYKVDGREFLRDNLKLADTFNMPYYKPSGSLYMAWGAHRAPPRQKFWDQDHSSVSSFARRGGASKRRY